MIITEQRLNEMCRASRDGGYAEYIKQYAEEDGGYGTLIDEVEEYEKNAKHQARLDACGKVIRFIDPHTGKFVHARWSCELFRECPDCLAHRAGIMHSRIDRAVRSSVYVYHGSVSSDEAKEIAKIVGKKCYLRCPQEDGSAHIFVQYTDETKNRLEKYGLEMVDLYKVNRQFFAGIICTPDGQRVTGGLGLIESTDEDQTIVVSVEQVVVEGLSREQEMEAMHQAVSDTADIYYSAPEEENFTMPAEELDGFKERFELSISKRMCAFKKRVAEKGGRISASFQHKAVVHINRIQWVNYTDLPATANEFLLKNAIVGDPIAFDLLVPG